VACLSQVAGDAELLPVLMQALLLALVATVRSIAADPGSTEMHVRVWQHAQDLLQVGRGRGAWHCCIEPGAGACSMCWLSLNNRCGIVLPLLETVLYGWLMQLCVV
jgi:hypothetical protein